MLSIMSATEQDFLTLKREFEMLATSFNTLNSLKISYEKNEFLLSTRFIKKDSSLLINLITLCKKHIENWRIHSFEPDFISLQALNNNLFQSDGILQNLKIKISSISYDNVLFEATKKGNLTSSEISLINELLKMIWSVHKTKEPLESLKEMGCKVYLPQHIDVSFNNFGGYMGVKKNIQDNVILPLLNIEVFQAIVAQTRVKIEKIHPKAILFSGPPGVGKTTMARIIAHEANCALVYIPLESILSSYYGESSKRLASIFDIAAEYASEQTDKNIILFLDEIDSLATSRDEKIFEATRRLLSVLLRNIDGLEDSGNCVTIGATNRKEDLDSALISRFDTIIEFPYPNEEDIIHILKLYATHLSVDQHKILAKKLHNKSPRYIKDICKKGERNRASVLLKEKTPVITPPSLEDYLSAL